MSAWFECYTQQIATADEKLTEINAIIAEIDSEGLTGTALATCLADDRTNHVTEKDNYEALKLDAETKLARLAAGWTGANLAIVTDINTTFGNKYALDLERLLIDGVTPTFFEMWGQATNLFQKTRLAKMTFRH